MHLTPELRAATERWIAGEVDEHAAAELRELLRRARAGQQPAADELARRMAGRLRFGTAGLRGPLRAGPNGMNRAVVAQVSAGLAAWLARNGHAGGLVVLGGDARHGSAEFVAEAAAVFAGAGLAVRVFDTPVPTPLVAYAVRACGAAAGVVITASHNPASDNGYKVYDETGAQIVPPADAEIEAATCEAPPAAEIPRSGAGTTPAGESTPTAGATPAAGTTPAAGIRESYLNAVAALPRGGARDLRIALTPLHGVGGELAVAALARAGFTDVHLVAEQAAPDPGFPTVALPNPEEPGACDRLLDLAGRRGADLAIALDPDADRCALGVPAPGGGFRMLSGDEAGILLGEHVLASLSRPDGALPGGALVATTIVSSQALQAIAAAHGARCAVTATGFKWLARADAQHGGEQRGELVYAYEEALGLCVAPQVVRDKDGIAAAVAAADLAAGRAAAGSSLPEMLDELARRDGVFATEQVALRVSGAEVVQRLRANPPATLAGVPVVVDDELPDPSALRARGPGLRVVARPSGTEAKVKAYLEVTEPAPGSDAELAASRRRAQAVLQRLRAEVTALLGSG